MPIKFNIRKGASIREDGRDPLVYTEMIDVTGFSNPDTALFDAYRHPRMPRKGSAHRAIPNLVVDSVQGEAKGTGATFRITYREVFGDSSVSIRRRKEETSEGLIQIGASLTTVETQRDNQGNPITVRYRPPGGDEDEQGVTVEIAAPAVERRIERVESEPDLSLAEEFTGAVNKSPIWGRDARTLLASVNFQSRDGGGTWTATYEFQYRATTWDVHVYHKDPETGSPTAGITLGNGIETKRVLPEKEFSRLRINFPR